MANKIEEATGISPASFVDSSSRYRAAEVIYYGDRRFITFKTYKKTPIESSQDDRFYVITKGTEFRPDLVSTRAYGNPRLWWRILEANNMKDVWEFRSGVNIVIPSPLV